MIPNHPIKFYQNPLSGLRGVALPRYVEGFLGLQGVYFFFFFRESWSLQMYLMMLPTPSSKELVNVMTDI